MELLLSNTIPQVYKDRGSELGHKERQYEYIYV